MTKFTVAFHNFAHARKNNPELTNMTLLFIIMMNYERVLEYEKFLWRHWEYLQVVGLCMLPNTRKKIHAPVRTEAQ